MTRGIAIRLFALLAAFLLGLWYIVFHALGYEAGPQPYDVTVALPSGGGLYVDASVTYRGVEVGKITKVDLRSDGVVVTASIRHRYQIPEQVQVAVHDLSAAGEEYLDLVPIGTGAPYLHGGSVVHGGTDAVPVQVGQLLADVGRLTASVNARDVSTVTDELAKGFGGTGDDLQRIVDDSLRLTTDLQAVQPQSLDLVTSGNTALTAVAASGPDLTRFAATLRTVSDTLAAEDVSVSRLLANGRSAAAGSQALLAATQTDLRTLLRDTDTITTIGAARQAAYGAMLDTLPTFGGLLASLIQDGRLQTFIFINNSAPVCSYGGTIAGPTTVTGPPDLTRHCTQSAPTLENRGADTAPRP